ncbi:MAG: class I SAM-dependent methyltransferase [Deltaproteobacteria bacterium]|nr:class I SAM-dependent methyltransferase [Deltaproteobacteria bacterium]
MTHEHHGFIPAMGHDLLLPLYDPLLRLSGGDRARRGLIPQARVEAGQRVLDLGCGTGTLLRDLLRAHPGITAAGIDPDPKALERTRAKLEAEGLTAELVEASAEELPFPDASFDRVFSSLMFHHLPGELRGPALREVLRVLKVGGSLHLLDFAGEGERKDGFLGRTFHKQHIAENYRGGLVRELEEAGFAGAREVTHRRLLFGFGRLGYFEGVRER